MSLRKRILIDRPVFAAAVLIGIGALLVTSLLIIILGAAATGILVITTVAP